MMQTKYRQTVIDLTKVAEANAQDQAEADAQARARIGYDERGKWCESDDQCAELRNGTARYSTPREDAILAVVVAGIFAFLGGAIYLCVHYGAAIDSWKVW